MGVPDNSGRPAGAGSPGVLPRDAVVFGRAYGEWSAAWHQWADSMPALKHPLFDTAPCSEGQSGPVWFLGGRFCAPEVNPDCVSAPAVRGCTVPAGKALYFPVLNISCLVAEANNNLCLDAGPFITQMRATLAGAMDQTTGLRVTLDGKPLKINLKRDFRVQSPVYTTIMPEGNLLQALGETVIGAGTYVGVDDGIYVMLEPLRKGSHVLNFQGTFPQFDFSLDFTYELTVQ
jgi:hypothetical protein